MIKYIDKNIFKAKVYERLFLTKGNYDTNSIQKAIELALIDTEEEMDCTCFTDIRTGKKYPFISNTIINCFGNNENKVWLNGDMTKYIVVDDDQIEYYKLYLSKRSLD